MNFAERRKQVFEKMERQSALILFSGIESHVSARSEEHTSELQSP